jgi:hypothetical protein
VWKTERLLLKQHEPQIFEVTEKLGPREFRFRDSILKYVVIAASGTMEPLEELTGYTPGGRTALQIFQTDVLPNVSRYAPGDV